MKKMLGIALICALSACDVLNEGGLSSSSTSSSSSTQTPTSSAVQPSSSSAVSDLQSVLFKMGGASSVNPSYLDADLMQTYGSGALTSSTMPLIDLVFSQGMLYSPTESSRITNPSQTWLIKVPVSFESITTQSQVVDLYNKYSSLAVTSMTPKTGDVIVIYTSEKKARLLKIESYSASDINVLGARVKF